MKTQKELLLEVHQCVLGVPDTDDRGLAGDVKDSKQLIIDQNDRVRKSEQKISKIWGILIGVGAVGGTGLGFGIKSLFGG